MIKTVFLVLSVIVNSMFAVEFFHLKKQNKKLFFDRGATAIMLHRCEKGLPTNGFFVPEPKE